MFIHRGQNVVVDAKLLPILLITSTGRVGLVIDHFDPAIREVHEVNDARDRHPIPFNLQRKPGRFFDQ